MDLPTIPDNLHKAALSITLHDQTRNSVKFCVYTCVCNRTHNALLHLSPSLADTTPVYSFTDETRTAVILENKHHSMCVSLLVQVSLQLNINVSSFIHG